MAPATVPPRHAPTQERGSERERKKKNKKSVVVAVLWAVWATRSVVQGAVGKPAHARRFAKRLERSQVEQGGAAGLSKVAGGRLGAAAVQLAERCTVALLDTSPLG
jgi:hypothetical protein